MKRLLLTLFLFAALATGAKAARYYYFEHLKTTDGLPSNTIYTSIQDKAGFMWIGTRDGLCRYDGRSFVRLDEIAPSELQMSGPVTRVAEDEEGKIWFCTSNSIGFYNPATDESGTIGIPVKSQCSDIKTDRNGNVWFASENLYRYDTAKSGIHTYIIGNSRPSMLATDSTGTIWVLLQDGTIYTYDKLKDTFKEQPLNFKVRIIEDADNGKMLMSTSDEEVILLDCISFGTVPVFKGRSKITCLRKASNGEIWIGTESGLFIRKDGEDDIREAFHDDATPNSISADFITCIDEDRNGNLWIGTYYTGLNIWRDKMDELAIYFTNPSANSSKGKVVRDITSDTDGNIWYCTEDGYLNRLNPQTQVMDSFSIDGGINMQVLVMDVDGMYICSFGNGLYL